MSVLIIGEKESDLSNVLMLSGECEFMTFSEALNEDILKFSALALLCGNTSERPKSLSARLMYKIDEFVESGKPIFYEWCRCVGEIDTIGDNYSDGRECIDDTTSRYVYCGENIGSLSVGDLLDPQSNSGCRYRYIPQSAVPVLYNGGHVVKHDHVDASQIDLTKIESRDMRLWYYDEQKLVCSFRFCDFIKARFAPFDLWCDVVKIIFAHLGIKNFIMPSSQYKLGGGSEHETFTRGLSWFKESGVLLSDGKDGVQEGMEHIILPDGTQRKRTQCRMDCVGEVAGAFLFDYLLNGTDYSFSIYKNLSSFLFDIMQVKRGKHKGMLRWTESAWGQTYADDTGRAVISTLFYIMYTGDNSRLSQIEDALDYLVNLTGTDGLIQHGFCTYTLSDERVKKLKSNPMGEPCAHRNAYYCAALLLAYCLNRKEIYLETAKKGLSSIMAVFPQTMRAISETEELCRLLFPLACLYQATGEDEHKKWIYDVCERLEIYSHKSGGYLEVDPDYSAYRSRTAGTESSMLADNGNEIADMLYSLNWLPLGFSYAYYVTGDNLFLQKWEQIAKFVTDTQIVSENGFINGAWARCLDLKRMEYYGMPHDVGWGPCCIESGWTVGEILIGLGFGELLKKGIFPTENIAKEEV